MIITLSASQLQKSIDRFSSLGRHKPLLHSLSCKILTTDVNQFIMNNNPLILLWSLQCPHLVFKIVKITNSCCFGTAMLITSILLMCIFLGILENKFTLSNFKILYIKHKILPLLCKMAGLIP